MKREVSNSKKSWCKDEDSEIKAKIERKFVKHDKKKNEKDKDIAKNKDASKGKEQSNIMSAFHIFRVSFKFSALFRWKISVFRFAFKSSSKSKSKAHVLKVKTKDTDLHKAFSIIIKEDFTMSEDSITSFWILNHDSDIHVINDIIQHRFVKERDYINEFIITTEKEMLTITSYESIIINVQTPFDIKTIKFLNVAYILKFMINTILRKHSERKQTVFWHSGSSSASKRKSDYLCF